MNEQANSPDSFRDQIRIQRLFILGAGFSAAAGIPMTGALLAGAMRRFQVECPGLAERVERLTSRMFRADSPQRQPRLYLPAIVPG